MMGYRVFYSKFLTQPSLEYKTPVEVYYGEVIERVS